jgi:hypothetical protein
MKFATAKASSTLLTRKSYDTDLTRGRAERSGEERIAWARYLIDDDDRAAIGNVHGVSDARWYVEWKGADGVNYHNIEPSDSLGRDLKPRLSVAADLRRASQHKLIRAGTDGEESELDTAITRLLEALDSADATLDESVLGQIRTLRKLWPSDLSASAPKYLNDLGRRLEELAERETAEHPRDAALRVLDARGAKFLLFGDEERNLKSDYELTEVADAPPKALANLARLAGLNLATLRDAVGSGDWGHAESLLEGANKALATAFADAWKQSGVTVRLRSDASLLRILISADGGGYTSIAERSDGLRAFIALLTFTALHDESPNPVLLIDEAENHLHYDAQADLVRVLTRQRAASKVIYTTHSAGCLPEDLGAVRVAVPRQDGKSEINNAFLAIRRLPYRRCEMPECRSRGSRASAAFPRAAWS